MNPVIQAQMREFSKSHSVASHAVDSQFEIYSIFSIMVGHLGESIDVYDAHLEGDEFGVDGVSVMIQGELIRNRQEAEEKLLLINNPLIEFNFFQAKISTSFDYGDISKFFDAVAGFFDGDLRGESQEIDDLVDAMECIYEKGVGRRNPRLRCYYATTGNYEEPSRIERLKNNFLITLKEKNIFDVETISIEFIGARELQQWYRAATSAIEVQINFPRNIVMPVNEHVEEAYVGYIDAKSLLELCSLKDSNGSVIGINRAVFFDNIRDYDPNSKINLSIKESVRSSGGAEFVFRNNGITVVSKNIDRTGDKFRLEDFQIVNGCQTSNIIFDLVYGEKTPVKDGLDNLSETIQIPFRLIGSNDDDFVSSIIVGTNRQNSVRDEQFWALRPFMKSFEEYAKSLEPEEVIYFERRENHYRNQKVEQTRIMQPSVLMKAIAACLLFQPQRAGRDYRGLLSEYENSMFLDDHDVRIYHAVAYLYYRLEFLWRNQRMPSSYKTFKYYILAGIGLRMSAAKSVFNMKKAKIAAVAEAILTLSRDEEKLKIAVNLVVTVIEKRLAEMSVTEQERIRDAIRSETFSSTFRERVVEP